MKKLAAVLSTAVLSALVPTASGAMAADCEQVVVRSWNVKVDIAKNVYRFGDKAELTLTVTRKKLQTPVSGATAAVMLTNSDHKAAFGIDETDAGGVAKIKVPVKRSQVNPGPVRLFAYVYTTQVDTACAAVVEYGYKGINKAFRVKR